MSAGCAKVGSCGAMMGARTAATTSRRTIANPTPRGGWRRRSSIRSVIYSKANPSIHHHQQDVDDQINQQREDGGEDDEQLERRVIGERNSLDGGEADSSQS